MIMHMFNLEKINLLKSSYNTRRLKIEFQTILQNMDQILITEAETGLKYINTAGFKILNDNMHMSENIEVC